MPIWIRASRKVAGLLPKPNSLRCKLEKSGRLRWLDVGSRRFDPGFICLDIRSPEEIPSEHLERYIELDLLRASNADIEALGHFDLVRLQHVFEHFSPEDGLRILKKLARIIAPGGFLLMTVPDLAIHVQAYLLGYRGDGWYRHFAHSTRISKDAPVSKDAPASFIFSCFAHQHGYFDRGLKGEAHCWCYDAAGLRYQLKLADAFENIKILSLWSGLAEKPFTHNRTAEDLCVLAQKKSTG